MASVALDTYEIVKELRAAGFSDSQAEAVTNAVKRAQQVDLSELATKADLKQAITDVKVDVLRWVIGLIGFQFVAILGGVAALIRLLQPGGLPTP